MSKFKFLKLGPAAGTFSDPRSKLFIANDQVVKVNARGLRNSKDVKAALSHRHIVEVEESEYEDYMARTADTRKTFARNRKISSEKSPLTKTAIIDEDEMDAEIEKEEKAKEKAEKDQEKVQEKEAKKAQKEPKKSGKGK